MNNEFELNEIETLLDSASGAGISEAWRVRVRRLLAIVKTDSSEVWELESDAPERIWLKREENGKKITWRSSPDGSGEDVEYIRGRHGHTPRTQGKG